MEEKPSGRQPTEWCRGVPGASLDACGGGLASESTSFGRYERLVVRCSGQMLSRGKKRRGRTDSLCAKGGKKDLRSSWVLWTVVTRFWWKCARGVQTKHHQESP
eukprot:3449244-Amphidinium_carterae.1